MSAALFNLTIDWVMRRTTEDSNRGIWWTLFSSLDDLDFANDLALTSHSHNHTQEKTDRLCIFGGQVWLKVRQTKTETFVLNIENPHQWKLMALTSLFQKHLHYYLGSIVRKDGEAEDDIKNRLTKLGTSWKCWTTSGDPLSIPTR